ncbi:branched-chain amino acid transport system ATP-binding protein [Salirhabdus euzebyi]|uniref:Branched-chain amino acid transport system ATP-binding protein n=1 Tax=Salirhabdus euzebyi TaxID=394506 RepID=A0A841Q5N2_9BACI|nr:ABC transporter ATP-binding protein [Salirhabdus euzebyi]MBB6453710.1 branched-chain amino acid transport system ATP-binding protein [Salirhabdus euzebyi]
MLLEVKGLTKRFGGLVAVNQVGFSVEEGKITALIGPNGAGKTTLFNCISGFYQPNEGEVLLNNSNIIGQPAHKILQKGLARTFQLVRNFEGMTILENIMTAAHVHSGQNFLNSLLFLPSVKKSEKELKEKANDILKFLNLAHVADKYPNEISYGQKRLVEIGKVLATDAKLLLMDEPAAGLNDSETRTLVDTMREIQKTGKSILIVEHNMKFIMELVQKIVVLDFGQKIAEGTPEEIRNNEKVIKAYLGGGKVNA